MIQPAPMTEDPLATLRDIHLPQAVPDWPPAMGWWLLLALGLIGLIWALQALNAHFRANAYRRLAQMELKAIKAEYQQNPDPRRALLAIQLLMKRAAMTAFNRAEVAALTGVAWTQFLDATCPKWLFSLGPGELLIDGPYQATLVPSTTEMTALMSLCAGWINDHSNKKRTSPKPVSTTHD